MKFVVFCGQSRGTTDPYDVYHVERLKELNSVVQHREYDCYHTSERYEESHGMVALDHDREEVLMRSRTSPLCRYCCEVNPMRGHLVKPCFCREGLSHAHLDCLAYAMQRNGHTECEFCHLRNRFYYADEFNYDIPWFFIRYLLSFLMHVVFPLLPIDLLFGWKLFALCILNVNPNCFYTFGSLLLFLTGDYRHMQTAFIFYVIVGSIEWMLRFRGLSYRSTTLYTFVHTRFNGFIRKVKNHHS